MSVLCRTGHGAERRANNTAPVFLALLAFSACSGTAAPPFKPGDQPVDATDDLSLRSEAGPVDTAALDAAELGSRGDASSDGAARQDALSDLASALDAAVPDVALDATVPDVALDAAVPDVALPSSTAIETITATAATRTQAASATNTGSQTVTGGVTTLTKNATSTNVNTGSASGTQASTASPLTTATQTATGSATASQPQSSTSTGVKTSSGTQTETASGDTSLTTATKLAASPNCTDVSYTAPYTLMNASGVSRLETPEGKQYLVEANWWHKFDGQSVAIDGLSFKISNPHQATVPAGDNNPLGYPSFILGSYQGRSTAKSNLPIQVSAIKSVNTILSSNALSKGASTYNVAYDAWFTPTSSPLDRTAVVPPSGGAYIGVWYFMPSGRQPRGINQHRGHSVSGVSGSWDVWIDNSNPPCVSYVRTTPVETLDFDLNKFIQDATNNGYGASTSAWKDKYLSVIFAGFEVWGGADGLQAKAFCADVQ